MDFLDLNNMVHKVKSFLHILFHEFLAPNLLLLNSEGRTRLFKNVFMATSIGVYPNEFSFEQCFEIYQRPILKYK